jgi:stromal membrane-associated protein
MEGPPPADPSVLDGAGAETPAEPEMTIQSGNVTRPSATQAAPPVQSNITPSLSHGQQQARQLLSSGVNNRSTPTAAQPAPTAPAAAPAPVQNDLFSLDFHAPASASPTADVSTTNNSSSKNVKQDILSLFSAPAAPAAQQSNFGQFGTVQPQQASSVWDSFDAPAAQPPAPQSMMGASGTGMWGVSSGWNQSGGASNSVPAQNNLWGAPAAAPAQPSLFDTSDVWSTSQPAASTAPPVSHSAWK